MSLKVQAPANFGLGCAIRSYRLAARLTQEQLADAFRFSVGLVRDLEQGRTHSPRWNSVEALTFALGLDEHERAQLATVWGCDAARPNQPTPVAIRILWPLVADRSEGPVDLGSIRRRAVLALLVLRGDEGVRMSELVDLLWPSGAPGSSASLVQKYISQLRQTLAGTGTSLVPHQRSVPIGHERNCPFGHHLLWHHYHGLSRGQRQLQYRWASRGRYCLGQRFYLVFEDTVSQ
ncbi:MAG: helix-turn-helix domain-containing protein [Streptosporangiaceae bacterium]